MIDSPGIRRRFLDNALEQTSEEYGIALIEYAKGIRQRNALLNIAQETGRKDPKQFNYWDELLIKYGNIITKEREEFINYINNKDKDIFQLELCMTIVLFQRSVWQNMIKQKLHQVLP